MNDLSLREQLIDEKRMHLISYYDLIEEHDKVRNVMSRHINVIREEINELECELRQEYSKQVAF